MNPKKLVSKTDPLLKREVGEASMNGVRFRVAALLKERYKLDELLAAGGFGVIYTGRDLRLHGKKILVKTNRYPRKLFQVQRNLAAAKQVERQRLRLEFERKMLLRAEKRGIGGVPVILDEVRDFGLDLYGPHQDQKGNVYHFLEKGPDRCELWTTEPFLVLSYVSGIPLNEAASRKWFRRNLLGNAKQVILQIGRILQGFHEDELHEGKKLSFVYQDLKPDNIMCTREKNYVLIDFGGFAVRWDNETLTRFAKTGTPGYQPPEFTDFAFPPRRIDRRADVFSLGATIYHALAGKAPGIDGCGNAAFDFELLKPVPEDWRKWVRKAVEPDPENRFSSMENALGAAHKLPLK